MKVVATVAVLAMTLVGVFGPKSSVGGPLTFLLVSLLIMWAVGLCFAWSKRFGVVGWLLSMLVAIAGGIVGIVVLGTTMDTIFEAFHFQGRLIDSNWNYLASASMALVVVLSAWAPLEVGTRLIARHRT